MGAGALLLLRDMGAGSDKRAGATCDRPYILIRLWRLFARYLG
jgi:hypothetical protein